MQNLITSKIYSIRIFYILIVISIFSVNANAQITYTWKGSIGNFVSEDQWIPLGVPGAQDKIIVDAGQVNITDQRQVAQFTFEGGSIVGDGGLIILQDFTWTSGTFEPGNDSIFIRQGASFSIPSGGSKVLRRALINETTCVWSGESISLFLADSRFINQGEFLIQTDADIGNGGQFINNGAIRKVFGPGITQIGSVFINNGVVEIQSGSIRPTNMSSGSGAYNITAGATLLLDVGTNTFDGNELSGDGTFEISGNTVKIDGAGLEFPSELHFKFTGGKIEGDGPIEIFGPFTWNNATMESGADTVWVRPGSDFNMDGGTLRRVMINQSTCTWTGQTVSLFLDSRFINQDSLIIKTDAGIGNGGRVINEGVLRKTASDGTTQIGSIFDNSGRIEIESGFLRPTNEMNSTGSFDISDGAELLLNAGTHTITDGILTGNGVFRLSGGTVNIEGTGLVFPSTIQFDFSSGTLDGDGRVDIFGPFNWGASGQLAASADTVWVHESSVFNLTGGTLRRAIVNKTTCTWTNASISLFAGSQIINQGIFDLQVDAAIGNGGQIINDGSFRKTAGEGTSQIGSIFVNNGNIEILSGTFRTTNTTTNSVSGIISGTGTFHRPTGTFTNDGTFSPGSSPGILSFTGIFPMSASAVLNVELGGNLAGTQYDRMEISQKAELNGKLNISLIPEFLPAVGDTFRVLNYASRSGEFAMVTSPANLTFITHYADDGLDIILEDDGSNTPPSTFSLISPTDGDTIPSMSEPANFKWNASDDEDGDTLIYTFKLSGMNSDTTITGLSDTSLTFNGAGFFEAGTYYDWTVMVSDGSVSISADTARLHTPVSTLVNSDFDAGLPKEFSLAQNYPNPFNPVTAIAYQLSAVSFVNLSIYNVLGQKINTLVSQQQPAGTYQVKWDAGHVAGGVYFYKIEAGEFKQVKKMILIK